MPSLTLRQQADALLRQYAPEIAAAYQQSIDEVKSKIILRVIVDRLERGDLNGVIDALTLDRAAFAPLELALTQAYQAGGTLMTRNFPSLREPDGARVVIRFDIRNPEAEAWLRTRSSDLVTGIVADQKATIRAALETGVAQGKNPTQTALEIVGRVNRVTGKREGGTIGLTGQQSQYVDTARDELASGDPAKLKNYLGRKQRDKRFDKAVTKAIAEGKPVPKETATAATQRYSDKLLKLRGDTIGRTESLTSLNASAHESFRQGLRKTNYADADVQKEWDSAGDDRVRHTHQILNGQKVQGIDTPFHSPSGAVMRFPGDSSLGAGAGEIIMCRCICKYRIDFFDGRA